VGAVRNIFERAVDNLERTDLLVADQLVERNSLAAVVGARHESSGTAVLVVIIHF
jgi:hypothetical protein